MMRKVVTAIGGVLFLPSLAIAQATIAGTVTDASKAVLPGVTVEVSSSALIEKVRSATTDGAGQYRIVDLRPGTYEVTFTLPGFTTIKRAGVELTGTFVATINVVLALLSFGYLVLASLGAAFWLSGGDGRKEWTWSWRSNRREDGDEPEAPDAAEEPVAEEQDAAA